MAHADDSVSLFFCGDVMTGRGIDQILGHPVDPTLHEPFVQDARRYVDLAERVNGAVPRGVDDRYIWGDALAVLDEFAPDLRIINLETSVTADGDFWPGKGIHYRMHPANAGCLSAARIDACVLANNHVLDFGYRGLEETLVTLKTRGIAHAGGGRTLAEAQAPTLLPLAGGARLLLVAMAWADSGVPAAWAATEDRPGVHLVGTKPAVAQAVATRALSQKRSGDLAVASIHWGGNWGYDITLQQRAFAHALIEAGFDLIHGHSSHHVKGVEIYRGHLILYGCGDLLNDYEGIGGEESYRGELSALYFPVLDRADGRVRDLSIVPTRIRRLQLHRTDASDTQWLFQTLAQECAPFGVAIRSDEQGVLRVSSSQIT